MASDSDLWLSIKAAQGKYHTTLEPTKESPNGTSADENTIVINHVQMPEGRKESLKKSPTPSSKRVLNQEEFDKRLKAKRALFSSKGRSLSLASFTNPVKRKVPKLLPLIRPKSTKTATNAPRRQCPDEKYLQENQVQGELEILGLESVIDVSDIPQKK